MYQNFNSILIANRGEIACRIIRTCRLMGIRSIAIYSEIDRDALFVQQADLAVFLGAGKPTGAYLDQEKIVAIAKQAQADAIHPGYGFLSENPDFARYCEANGVRFIGPRPEVIEAMGSKSRAKEFMQQQGVPTVPGYQGSDQSLAGFQEAATKIGFPLLLKASDGGGGKGMRIIKEAAELEQGILAAKREALSAFGNDELILEKYIATGRHIEFQIFGDQYGNIIHLFERECSIQRRYQKIIEESPSPALDKDLREQMVAVVLKASKALRYDNAGTIEFILDEKNKAFYFLEVNTRLQVEHPVTEAITGLDLVKMQIESAQGMPLSVKQGDVKQNGHAIECRLYAEDAANNFAPVPGTILRFELPEIADFRIETAIQSGSVVSIYYDPMIAKLVVWGEDRNIALRKMAYALQQLICLGTITNQNCLQLILNHPDFQLGQYNTHFIKTKLELEQLAKTSEEHQDLATIAATLYIWHKIQKKRTLLKALPSGWRNSFYQHQQHSFLINKQLKVAKYRAEDAGFSFLIGGESYNVLLNHINQHGLFAEINGVASQFNVAQNGRIFHIHHLKFGNIQLLLQPRFPLAESATPKGNYEAPMPSQIVKIMINLEQEISIGDPLVVLSSMKMENTIYANTAGTVEEIYVQENTHVEAGTLLLKIAR